MAVTIDVSAAVDLDGIKARVFAEFLGCDLIDGNSIGETHAWLRESIGACEPEGAARMSGVVEEAILVPQALHDGEIPDDVVQGERDRLAFCRCRPVW